MTVEATPCLGFSLPEASPLSADGFPHDAPAGGCSLLFPVIIACICIYIVPPEFRVHMILESRPDWLLHGCLGTLQGIGGRWAGPGLVLTGRQPPHRQDSSHLEHCPPEHQGRVVSSCQPRPHSEVGRDDPGRWLLEPTARVPVWEAQGRRR